MIYLGTEVVGDEVALTVAQRAGRCYELAAYALTLGYAVESARLVHASVRGEGPLEGQRFGHAWLEFKTGMIWEPMQARFWRIDAWMRRSDAIIEVSYAKRETQELILRTGHWGPWH